MTPKEKLIAEAKSEVIQKMYENNNISTLDDEERFCFREVLAKEQMEYFETLIGLVLETVLTLCLPHVADHD